MQLRFRVGHSRVISPIVLCGPQKQNSFLSAYAQAGRCTYLRLSVWANSHRASFSIPSQARNTAAPRKTISLCLCGGTNTVTEINKHLRGPSWKPWVAPFWVELFGGNWSEEEYATRDYTASEDVYAARTE